MANVYIPKLGFVTYSTGIAYLPKFGFFDTGLLKVPVSSGSSLLYGRGFERAINRGKKR